jgi:aconitate hydratase
MATYPVSELKGDFGACRYVDLRALAGAVLERMPLCHRILLENVARHGETDVTAASSAALRDWSRTGHSDVEIPFAPRRILMHDTTCGPALVDIAAMRDAIAEAGGDPARLNPAVPVATSVDHSIAIDRWARPDALQHNLVRELERNAERYRFMKWAASAVRGFGVFPPGSGIMHTINLERLASVVECTRRDGVMWAVPDTLVGTDSHTPMVNGLGVLGWGVGGIEAEGVMFGVPISLRIPDVIGVALTGALPPGTLATDLALVVTERLRRAGVAGEFVEFFGPGVATLSAGERAVVANMAPEYGASTGFFPIDARTLEYLAATGRAPSHVDLVGRYATAQGLWYEPDAAPRYTRTIDIDLSALRPSLAGPRRPQDRIDPSDAPRLLRKEFRISVSGEVPEDAVAIAAITSCTNTTDIGLLIAAGVVARNARRLGMAPPPWVKTSLAPGSPTAARRLSRAGVLGDLEALGFGIAAYGCTTCIGNSGPLAPMMDDAIKQRGLTPIAVLSGNRNFPGRVHGQIDTALLASPPLVIAYALVGRALLDITQDPLGVTSDGRMVRLADLWPQPGEVASLVASIAAPQDFDEAYAEASSSRSWRMLDAPQGDRFPWDPQSTYLRTPPFVHRGPTATASRHLRAHPLLVVGDDVTTDHISPAGAIPPDSDAGRWLVAHGESAGDLNVYAARRGNWEVMLRGLFTNRNLVNALSPDAPPGHTFVAGNEEPMPVWRAGAHYAKQSVPTVILAGERYGTGSSRDWAAKGLCVLGVRAVLANSFERIHRSNLIGMGILPLQLPADWRAAEMGIAADDVVEIDLDLDMLKPQVPIRITLQRAVGGEAPSCRAIAAVQTTHDVSLIQAGGMIPMILRRALAPEAVAGA